jgi:hypothetical protein
MVDNFPPEMSEILRWYVYRIIDPRTGQTFYVGKGRGNRVFSHVRDGSEIAIGDEEDAESLKVRTIREIRRAGFEPLHVIHRHGLTEEVAFEVEAALIDAYPGLTNIAGGHGNGERGCRHAEELVRIYAAKPLVVSEDLILIYIGRARDEGRDVYSAVRCAWRMSQKEAEKRKLVLAYDGGLVVGAYRPEQWLTATNSNFPELPIDFSSKRIGFHGRPAMDVWSQYVGTRPPPRKKGTQTPFRYMDVE